MRALLFIALAVSAAFGQPQSELQKLKVSDVQLSIVKIVVAGIGPAGYTSVGTGFFVSDHEIASASHVYLEAAKAMVDSGAGTIAALRLLPDGKRVAFALQFCAADFVHDTVLLAFDPEIPKKAGLEVKPLKYDETKLEIGDDVAFFGYFAGDEEPILSRTILAGYTTAVPGTNSTPEQMILGLPANPGQSGSPVFSLLTGDVVGILTAFVPVTLVPGSLPTHSGLSRSVEVVHLKRLIESEEVRCACQTRN